MSGRSTASRSDSGTGAPSSRRSRRRRHRRRLHQLGEGDLAKLYYDVALAIFETATTSTAAWLYYGDIKQKKVDHINGQKALLGEQKKPAITHYYIDANGRRRGFYDTEASWFSYSSWVAWYFGAADPAVPSAPAAPAP